MSWKALSTSVNNAETEQANICCFFFMLPFIMNGELPLKTSPLLPILESGHMRNGWMP